MDLNSIDHHTASSPDGTLTFKASIVLYICSWMFFIFQTISADAIWTWTWRALSAISLILIIYINWNKALDIFKNKKKNKKS